MKSLESIIPRAIEVKCAFAEIKLKNEESPEGRKIKRKSIIVRATQIAIPARKAMI